jgi:hypothetical protein
MSIQYGTMKWTTERVIGRLQVGSGCNQKLRNGVWSILRNMERHLLQSAE